MAKDLYKLLGLPMDASAEDIAARLEGLDDPDAAEDVRAILGDPLRREAYDRCHAALLLIGRLRAELGLTRTVHWSAREFADYLPDRPDRPDRPVQNAGDRPPVPAAGPLFLAGRGSAPARDKAMARFILLMTGLVIGVTCISTLLFSME
jgi:hypothetical protein